MSLAYTPFKANLLKGEFNLHATDDIRVILVMSNSTADTEEDTEFVDDFTTLDEYDGANYVRKSLAAEAVAQDDPNDRGEFDATDLEYLLLGVGTRQCIGAIVYKFVTNDADSPVMGYINTGGFPFDGNGGTINLQWNAEGILQAT